MRSGAYFTLRVIMGKRTRRLLALSLFIGLSVTVVALPVLPAYAEVVLPALVIREVKIKGDDFMVLQANADVELGEYWLGYSSSEPIEKLKQEHQLASGVLHAGEALLIVGDATVPTCDAVLAMDMPMDLAETKGAVALWRRDALGDGRSVAYNFIDGFSWTNAKTGVADIVRPTSVEDGLTTPTWFRKFDTSSAVWQVADLVEDDEQGCMLISKMQVVLGVYTVVTEAAPPAVIETGAEETLSTDGTVPTQENTGLIAPQITELLPNPAGTGTDATDEFIELYNPNSITYDISGYTMQTGLTTKHSYIFPEGTIL